MSATAPVPALVPLKAADRDFFEIGLPAIWKRIERGQMPVALHRRGRRWYCQAADLLAWRQAGGWGVEIPATRAGLAGAEAPRGVC